MNQPPAECIRVPHDELRKFVSRAGQTAGLPEEMADRLAEMLTENDLRGVFSHGTRQMPSYVTQIRDGEINPTPQTEVIRETPVSVLLDGNGGLGYFTAEEGTRRAITKASEVGMASMVTRNHGHVGAAGLYTRQAVEHDLLAFVTSGHQLSLSAGESIYDACGAPPMTFCAPTAEEHPVVLDFSTTGSLNEHRDAIAKLSPGLVHISLGLGAICQSWGGLLAGLGLDGPPSYQEYSGAYQGSMGIFLRVDLFTDPDRFKQEMDTYVRQVRDLEPLDGFDAHLPGGPESVRQQEYREEGIPLDRDRRTELEEMAEDLGLTVPWA